MQKQLLLFFLLVPFFASAQELTGIASKWDDDLREWSVFTYEGEEGELRMRWQLQNDWTEWEYRLGEATGSIKVKWDGNLNTWEIRGNNDIITARTIYNDDPSQWRITDDRITLQLHARWSNQLEEWSLRTNDYGTFAIYTTWEGDPRDWTVEDSLDNSIGLPMKMALVFVAIFPNIPKG